jgi:hypothetical protein
MILVNHKIYHFDGLKFISINHHDKDFHVILYIILQYYLIKIATSGQTKIH